MLAYWLVPAEPHYSWCQREIERLAREFDAPAFHPHVTIHSAAFPPPKKSSHFFPRHLEQLLPCTLHPQQVNHSEQFTKTLFIELAGSPALTEIADRLRAFTGDHEYELRPHLSLLYKNLKVEEREGAAATIKIPSEPLRFGEIAAVRSPRPASNESDVRAWQIVERISPRG